MQNTLKSNDAKFTNPSTDLKRSRTGSLEIGPEQGRRASIKFGTDGWRGIIAQEFNFENVKVVSQAIADYMIGLKEPDKE